MRPHVPQLIQHFHLSKRTQYALHQACFAHRLLHAVKPLIDHTFRSDNARYTTCNLAQHIETASDHLFASGHRACHLLDGFQPWIYQGYREEPDAVLDGWRKYSDLRE